MGSTITLHQLSKTHAGGHRAVQDISLHLQAGEFLVLLGLSGCGKSTMLRMIAGLETATSGELLLDNQPAGDLPPSERDVAMIFQNFALYPHMSAAENIAFPLASLGDDEHTVADRLGIRSLLTRTPAPDLRYEQLRAVYEKAAAIVGHEPTDWNTPSDGISREPSTTTAATSRRRTPTGTGWPTWRCGRIPAGRRTRSRCTRASRAE
ncbi:ATP-binding cassette domain-containing protein [Streptomyces sp. NPDC006458]|uniref:ATP-binding cassette domain-containing protein n=1 Tax=Streptomyces sp. NPDC006458 TaxID=3154302 RepID=UPI0033A4BA58